jgi:hypothetical protein
MITSSRRHPAGRAVNHNEQGSAEDCVNWFDHHHRSKQLVAAAQSSLRRGDEAEARQLYAEAAQEAERAVNLVPRDRQITLGLVAMLAAKLWRRADRADDAARMARLIRESPDLFPVTLSPLDRARPAPTSPKRP